MKTAKSDTTAMLLNFNKLSDANKRKAIAEIEKVANKYKGTVAQTMDYASAHGGVTIYQP